MRVDLERSFTAGAAIAGILMLRAANPLVTCLVVEGPDDIKLFRKLSSPDCRVVAAGNREQVLRALRELHGLGIQGVAGVVDRDYADFRSETYPDSALMPEENDIELMLLRSRAFPLALCEAVVDVPAVLEHNGFRFAPAELVMWIAQPLGRARLASHRCSLDLSFAGIRLRNHVGADGVSTDCEALAQDLANRTSGTLTTSQIERAMKAPLPPNLPLFLVCRGHDAIQACALAIEKGLFGPVLAFLSETQLASVLRASFSQEHFRETRLRQSFADWEDRWPGYRLLCS